jgi:hypothetical protein
MDAIDNRNLELLTQVYNDRDPAKNPGSVPPPKGWCELPLILLAMRKAGDEALLDQVTVRLERSFGSTQDVRAGAKLVTG